MSVREHFSINRASEYFDAKELQTQTGQPIDNFGDVVVKELIDNSLDACETARIEPQITIRYDDYDDIFRLMISDNGTGMSESVIDSIVDFNTRTSDKACYRAPSRGAQGNALKTVIGIATALLGYVVITSHGVQHTIEARVTPSGNIDICHNKESVESIPGASVYVECVNSIKVDALKWLKSFAFFNPHANVKIEGFEKNELCMLSDEEADDTSAFFYNSLGTINKITPSDPPSIHCYDLHSFKKLLYLQGEQHNLPIGQFVRQFKGLTSSAKAKTVCRGINGQFVTDIYNDDYEIELLHDGMLSECIPVKPKSLGAIGEARLLSRVNNVDRHWYKQVSGLIDTVPYVFEILIAENGKSEHYYGVNHSPTFGDFLADPLVYNQLHAWSGESALEFICATECTVIIHLIGIGLTFLDRGKSKLSLPVDMREKIASAFWLAGKTLYKEGKARERDASAAERADEARQRKNSVSNTLKNSILYVLGDAIDLATTGETLPCNVRNVFYKVRSLIQKYTDKDLTYSYFNNILDIYWRNKGRHPLVYSDPRGVLYEPHSNKEVPLGTKNVLAYNFPEYHYNKILYIEKKGLWPTIEASGIPKRFDMAIIAAEGYATEAARVLMSKAQKGLDYTIFVLHDADPDGYNISRTIREETEKMPDNQIEVIDIGLTIQDALDLGLESETFIRKKKLNKKLVLNELELEYFEGEVFNSYATNHKDWWRCKRFELNAMTSGEMIDYINGSVTRAIENKHLDKKVIPPESKLLEEAESNLTIDLEDYVDDYINEHFNVDDIKTAIVKKYMKFDTKKLMHPEVKNFLEDDELEVWQKGVKKISDSTLSDINDRDDIDNIIAKLLN